MAISIVYGIMIATILTLLLLPIFLSVVNSLKVHFKWFYDTNNWLFWQEAKPSKESVERAVKELKNEQDETYT